MCMYSMYSSFDSIICPIFFPHLIIQSLTCSPYLSIVNKTLLPNSKNQERHAEILLSSYCSLSMDRSLANYFHHKHIVLHRTAPHHIALHCTAPYRIAPHRIAPHHTASQCIALHCMHCTVLHCVVLHCVALHCTASHCTAPHSTAPHRIALYL